MGIGRPEAASAQMRSEDPVFFDQERYDLSRWLFHQGDLEKVKKRLAPFDGASRLSRLTHIYG